MKAKVGNNYNINNENNNNNDNNNDNNNNNTFWEWWANFTASLTRKSKVSSGKSKVMIFERKKVDLHDFITPYRVNVPAVGFEAVLWEKGGSKSVPTLMNNIIQTWKDERRNKRGLWQAGASQNHLQGLWEEGLCSWT